MWFFVILGPLNLNNTYINPLLSCATVPTGHTWKLAAHHREMILLRNQEDLEGAGGEGGGRGDRDGEHM